MTENRPKMGIHEGTIIWHVDENGIYFTGSPEARLKAIWREERRREKARDDKLLRERPVRAPGLTRER